MDVTYSSSQASTQHLPADGAPSLASASLMAGVSSLLDLAPVRVMQTKSQPTEAQNDMMANSSTSPTDTVEAASRPPSPPSTGTNTPTLRIMPCPERLLPIYPPFNYGTVEHQRIFRSAFPLERNIDFVMRLKIKTLLCLVNTVPTEQYTNWVAAQGVTRLVVDIAPNKDGVVKTTTESLFEAVLYIMTQARHPILLHCNHGKHRTGCVIACVRKINREGQDNMTLNEILEEYAVYAGKKARSGDIALIRAFDPKAFLKFAAACNHDIDPHTGFLVRRRVDSGTVIRNLRGLPCTDVDFNMLVATASRVSSSSDDEGLEMASSRTSVTSQDAVDRLDLIMGNDAGHQHAVDRLEQIMGPTPGASTSECPTSKHPRPSTITSAASTHDAISSNHPVGDSPMIDVEMTITEVADDDLTPPALEYTTYM